MKTLLLQEKEKEKRYLEEITRKLKIHRGEFIKFYRIKLKYFQLFVIST